MTTTAVLESAYSVREAAWLPWHVHHASVATLLPLLVAGAQKQTLLVTHLVPLRVCTISTFSPMRTVYSEPMGCDRHTHNTMPPVQYTMPMRRELHCAGQGLLLIGVAWLAAY